MNLGRQTILLACQVDILWSDPRNDGDNMSTCLDSAEIYGILCRNDFRTKHTGFSGNIETLCVQNLVRHHLKNSLENIKRTDNTEIVLSSDSSTECGKKTKGFQKSDKATANSSLNTSSTVQRLETKHRLELSLVDLILMEENSRSKCSKVGESHCYKTFQ